MAKIGENDYREGARARIVESAQLFRGDKFAGSVYLAGRAVECMFRGLIWKPGQVMETGHDLKKLLAQVGKLGLLYDCDGRTHDEIGDLRSLVDVVANRWFNNMRFVSDRWVESYWRAKNVVTKRRTFKWAVSEFCDVCSMIVARCEVLYGKADKT